MELIRNEINDLYEYVSTLLKKWIGCNLDLKVVINKEFYLNGIISAYSNDAGCDLKACIDERIVITPGQSVLIPLGIHTSFNSNYVGYLIGRSGLGTKHRISLTNKIGVIDAGFRNEWKAALANEGINDMVIEPGMRICQVVFTRVASGKYRNITEVESIDDLGSSDRGMSGFGSSGTV